MKKVAIHNLGCKVNSYEAESMEQMLRAAGYSIVPFDENELKLVANPKGFLELTNELKYIFVFCRTLCKIEIASL